MPTETRILILDDHPMVREGLKKCINNRPGLRVCGEAETVDQALQIVKSEGAELAIVDLSLHDGHGLDFIKLLHKLFPQTKAIVHSMHDDFLYAERSLKAGAHGYVNKRSNPVDLLEAINRVLDGQIYLPPETMQRMLGRQVHSGADVVNSDVSVLSDRELEVFHLIGQGLSNRHISNRLHVSPHTVDSHREKIKTKLGLKSGTELSRRAFQWVLELG